VAVSAAVTGLMAAHRHLVTSLT